LVVAPGRVEIKRAQMILQQLSDWRIAVPVLPVWVIRRKTGPQIESSVLSASLGREVAYTIPYSSEPLIMLEPETPAAKVLQGLADILANGK